MTTIREMVSEVLDNLERFPQGWGTTVKDYFKAKGKDCFERQQKKVWMLTIRQPDAEADYAVSVYRTRAKAIAAMEEDIEATLAARQTGIHSDAELERDGDLHAKIGSEVDWEITHETLWN